jgi:prepilin-type N-terminal cleavage/methylation domain-containing protein
MRRGFTLIELIMVVIVIGVLATIAVPQYMTATERAKGGKAKNALVLISQGEKLLRAETDAYAAYATKAAIQAGLAPYLELNQIAADTDWLYATVATSTTFTATATRVAGGKNAAETITMDQDGVTGGTFTP